jgi:hypothetical protein
MESYPSSQLRFKADNGRALDGGDIYLRDERDQVTGQPSTVVVHPTVIFGHGRLLEEVDEFWNLPHRHSCGTTSWRRSHHCSAFRLRVVPESSALADGATGAAGAWTMVSAIEQWMVKAMEDEKARARNDGTQ